MRDIYFYSKHIYVGSTNHAFRSFSPKRDLLMPDPTIQVYNIIQTTKAGTIFHLYREGPL